MGCLVGKSALSDLIRLKAKRRLHAAVAIRVCNACQRHLQVRGKEGERGGGLPQSKDRREGRLPVLAAVSTVKLSGMLTA